MTWNSSVDLPDLREPVGDGRYHEASLRCPRFMTLDIHVSGYSDIWNLSEIVGPPVGQKYPIKSFI